MRLSDLGRLKRDMFGLRVMTSKMWKWTLIVCFLNILMQTCLCEINKTEEKKISSFQIIGLFESAADAQMRAFNESMHYATADDRQFEPVVYTPKRSESYSIWRQLCSDKAVQPIAVFGPQNPLADRAVFNQCSRLHIPFLQATWQPFDPDMEPEESTEEDSEDDSERKERRGPKFRNVIINFYPDGNEVAAAYADVLSYYNWENFVVLYEDDYGLTRVQKIIAEYSKKFPIIVRRLDPGSENYEVFKELSKMQESRILLDCHVDRILSYLKVAEGLNMMNPYQHYVLTSMDANMVVQELMKYSSNFTWLSLTDYESLKDPQHYLTVRVGKWTKYNAISPPPATIFPTDALLMDDVANHILKSMGDIHAQGTFPCSANGRPWRYGAKLQDSILKTTSIGITGNITFDESGRRTNYSLNMNEIYQMQIRRIASWESKSGEIVIIPKFYEIEKNKTSAKQFKVMSRMAEPYFMIKKNCTEEPCEEDEYPDEKYEGFSVDLVRHIFEIIREEQNHTYIFIEDKDISYGKFDNLSKKWDGLIGKLLDKQADLVVCDLTITEGRKKIVDFSVPFMTLGISILFTKDVKVSPEIFSFLKPYSVEMWIYTGTAYCVVSILLFVCSRISPADWENPQPCDKDPEELENIWNFKNCTWLTMGSIMTQGCDILPKAFGSRWVCAMWWFFAMIVCQTYIAQLAASMTTAMDNAPIDTVEDLAKQTKVLYGAFESGSTFAFFQNSKDKMFHQMYENMLANPGVLVESNEKGEQTVVKGRNKYAFFMESVTIEYKQKRNCDLRKVGGELDSKDYGIAMPANSPYRSDINRAILKLKENNKLNDIKEKWWNSKKYGAQECDDTKDANDVEGDLEMEHLRGAFYVLIGGLFICLFITAFEFLNEVRNIVVREQVTHKEVLIKELKSSLNFLQLQKPVIRNPSRAPSIASSEKSNKSKKRAQFIENFLEFEKEPQ